MESVPIETYHRTKEQLNEVLDEIIFYESEASNARKGEANARKELVNFQNSTNLCILNMKSYMLGLEALLLYSSVQFPSHLLEKRLEVETSSKEISAHFKGGLSIPEFSEVKKDTSITSFVDLAKQTQIFSEKNSEQTEQLGKQKDTIQELALEVEELKVAKSMLELQLAQVNQKHKTDIRSLESRHEFDLNEQASQRNVLFEREKATVALLKQQLQRSEDRASSLQHKCELSKVSIQELKEQQKKTDDELNHVREMVPDEDVEQEATDLRFKVHELQEQLSKEKIKHAHDRDRLIQRVTATMRLAEEYVSTLVVETRHQRRLSGLPPPSATTSGPSLPTPGTSPSRENTYQIQGQQQQQQTQFSNTTPPPPPQFPPSSANSNQRMGALSPMSSPPRLTTSQLGFGSMMSVSSHNHIIPSSTTVYSQNTHQSQSIFHPNLSKYQQKQQMAASNHSIYEEQNLSEIQTKNVTQFQQQQQQQEEEEQKGENVPSPSFDIRKKLELEHSPSNRRPSQTVRRLKQLQKKLTSQSPLVPSISPSNSSQLQQQQQQQHDNESILNIENESLAEPIAEPTDDDDHTEADVKLYASSSDEENCANDNNVTKNSDDEVNSSDKHQRNDAEDDEAISATTSLNEYVPWNPAHNRRNSRRLSNQSQKKVPPPPPARPNDNIYNDKNDGNTKSKIKKNAPATSLPNTPNRGSSLPRPPKDGKLAYSLRLTKSKPPPPNHPPQKFLHV